MNGKELLNHIRSRPGLYLGKKSAERLDLFIAGINCAEFHHQVSPEKTLLRIDWTAFQAWIDQVHNPERLSLNSFSLAARQVGSDELGFDRWFEWYDEWQSRTK